ncbi:MAG: hypothetical protein QXT25_03350 [Candidatus Anstonellaceae archaeon]
MALLFHLSISKSNPTQLRVPLSEYQEHARVEASAPASDIQRIALGAEMSLVRYSGLALWPCTITVVMSEQVPIEQLPVQPVTGTVTWTEYGDDWKGIYNSPGVAVLDDGIRLGLLDYVAWLYDNRGSEYAHGVRKFFATLRRTSF